MNFTKIQFTEKTGRVRIDWSDYSETGSPESHVLKSDDLPHPDFLDALQGMKAAVVSMCMLEDQEHLLTIRSVTIKDSGETGRGIVITALRELDWIETPQVVNTPFASLTLIPMHPGDDLEDLLDDLEDEAAAYVRGKRAQGDLFESGDEEAGLSLAYEGPLATFTFEGAEA